MIPAAWTVYLKELVDALRDRRTLLMVVLSSVAIGPVMLVALSALISGMEQRAEAREVYVRTQPGGEVMLSRHDLYPKQGGQQRPELGGRSELAREERLFRFQFPERPGALLKFLSLMAPGWNISLFHYRNHGAAEGRVLVGLQLGTHREAELQQGLAALGYPVVDITDSVGYRLFLR